MIKLTAQPQMKEFPQDAFNFAIGGKIIHQATTIFFRLRNVRVVSSAFMVMHDQAFKSIKKMKRKRKSRVKNDKFK